MTQRASRLVALAAPAALILFGVAGGGAAQKPRQDAARGAANLEREVRHVLVMLPYYGVFDNLEFRIQPPDTVVLAGQVTRPTLKRDAENVVKRLESVSKVVNEIEVLPVSPNDEQLRVATYRAVFSRPGLDRYGMMAVPPIHIIVKGGNIRLIGVVATQADKDLAGIAAKGVSGAFGVQNDLQVEKK
jgi:hyperosmotically inducible protein